MRQIATRRARHDVIGSSTSILAIEHRYLDLFTLLPKYVSHSIVRIVCKRKFTSQPSLNFSKTQIRMVKDDQTVIEQVPGGNRITFES